MKFLDKGIVGLTYDEEMNLAKTTYDCLLSVHIPDEFYTYNKNMYFNKIRYGVILTVSDLEYILLQYDNNNITYPKIKEDGKFIDSSSLKRFYKNGNFDKEMFSYTQASTRSRAWFEMWERHLIKNSNEYSSPLSFEVESLDYRRNNQKEIKQLQKEYEIIFATEIERVIKEHDFSNDEAIQWVSEYIPNPFGEDFFFEQEME